jgi:lysophospholipase L1-like esterase
MGRVDRARRIAVAAAYGGTGIGLAGALAAGLLVGQARLARLTIPLAEAPPPRCDGRYGAGEVGEPVRLVLVGDSSAAGFGVEQARHTPGAVIAAGLAGELRRPVELRCFAVVGATSAEIAPQVQRALAHRPQVAVILVGANDVTHLVKTPVAVAHLADAVRTLREAGAEVVVGTCPDLGTIRPIQPPLRWLARGLSRSLAAAQTIATVEAGGRTVSLGDLLGPEFAKAPDRMFAADRFHPSEEGYRAAALALLPSALMALGAPSGAVPEPAHDEAVRTLPEAAVEAAGRAGTEVSGAVVAGADRGPGGRWAQLRRRVRLAGARPADPVPDDPAVRLREDPPAPKVAP